MELFNDGTVDVGRLFCRRYIRAPKVYPAGAVSNATAPLLCPIGFCAYPFGGFLRKCGVYSLTKHQLAACSLQLAASNNR